MKSAVAKGTARTRRAPGQEPVSLALLGAFELSCGGRRVDLPMSAQRLLAFLALHDRPLMRVYVAGALWLDTPEDRAAANLRSSLWRLHQPGARLVDATNSQLKLAPDVTVDAHETAALAHRLLAGSREWDDLDVERVRLRGELLSDWYEDWILIERERLRQLSLHALEIVGERLLEVGRLAGALEAALAAVTAEPLRESAHRLLIKVHIAEGNGGEAIRQLESCRRLFADQLGLAPSPLLEALVRDLTL